jgi:hypothetical protein
MTTFITRAFGAVEEQAPIIDSGDATRAIILLIDEADALAQSRETDQMHHEDRAGVNALIRGIDTISTQRRPVITVLCTNRLDALDPAVRRRAFGEFAFTRPGATMRATLLAQIFHGVGFNDQQIGELAELTGENGRGYGFTYSDITTRLASTVLLDAFDHKQELTKSDIEYAAEKGASVRRPCPHAPPPYPGQANPTPKGSHRGHDRARTPQAMRKRPPRRRSDSRVVQTGHLGRRSAAARNSCRGGNRCSLVGNGWLAVVRHKPRGSVREREKR